MKRVAVLGSTGSIGRNTLEVIASHPEKLSLAGLATRSRVDVLAEQVRRLRPPRVAVWEPEKAQELARLVPGLTPLIGLDGLTALATHPDVDIVVVATSGREALVPLIRAIQAGKRIALANKELLVIAGELIMRLVREHGTSLVPVDSEHAGLFQCLAGLPRVQVRQVVVTGSGGPLWATPAAAIAGATRAQVLAHPKWTMGPKITVDSATLMNKGLEVIEAHWLFDLPLDCLKVLIHPEAAVHALIELVDGAWLAQVAPCDMRLPIQYALSYPERWESHAVPRLDLTRLGAWRFHEPDLDRFPCLRLALEAARQGGTACVALNGANDAAVHAFLEDQIAFGDIPRIIADTLEHHQPVPHPSLEDILAVDAWARATAGERIHQCSVR